MRARRVGVSRRPPLPLNHHLFRPTLPPHFLERDIREQPNTHGIEASGNSASEESMCSRTFGFGVTLEADRTRVKGAADEGEEHAQEEEGEAEGEDHEAPFHVSSFSHVTLKSEPEAVWNTMIPSAFAPGNARLPFSRSIVNS